MRTSLFATALCLLTLPVAAQKKETYKFEKINPTMLQKRSYAVDTGASAVILADIGETEIEGNSKGFFSFVFRRHKRVHILSKAGYDEATFEIPLYHNGVEEEEKLDNVKATSYNLENGQVVETKLSRDNIFTEKQSKQRDIKKFTLPAVKEGTIIDIEYKITSDYLYTLQPWDFQGLTPRLWSEYTLSVPQFLEYLFIYKGFIPFYINEKKDHSTQFTVVQQTSFGPSDRSQFLAGVTEHRWVTKDVPGFKTEAYVSTFNNYLSHMDFQLASFRDPLRYKNFVPTWEETAKDLLKSESFGVKLESNNGYLSETMRPLMKGSKAEQARAIYAYVRDNFACDNQHGIYLQSSVKDVFKSGKGTVAEINLLLVTMLRYAGFTADPVMLSTRSHGTVFTSYPMLSRFNYIIAATEVEGLTCYLDASQKRLGFNHLPADCYNGMGRTINEFATPVLLMPDSLRETRMTNLFFGLPDAKGWSGSYSRSPGYYESLELRQLAAEKGRDALDDKLKKSLGAQLLVKKTSADSLDRFDSPLTLRADIGMELNGEDIVYINPMFGSGMKENPFKSPERNYPVEMPYTIDDVYNFTLYMPSGYTVDELPKPMRMRLNGDNDGYFEYLISYSQGVISLRSRITLSRASFTPEEYDSLREFFNRIVAKHNEQIVLKKTK
jgi:hypothetical protein